MLSIDAHQRGSGAVSYLMNDFAVWLNKLIEKSHVVESWISNVLQPGFPPKM
jgi:hypothetical protein